MADISKSPDEDTSSRQIEQQLQTIDTFSNCSNITQDDDNDLVNVDDEHLPYTFNFDPFSPSNSSFFVPSSSFLNQQVNSNSCSYCSSEPESETDCPDSSTVYPDCLYNNDIEYDHIDFITDLFDSRDEIEHVSGLFSSSPVGTNDHDNDDDFVSNNIEELGLGLRVTGIDSDSDTEELGQVDNGNDDRNRTTDLNFERFWECQSFNTDRVVNERERGLSSVINRIEEISVSSELSSEGDAAVGNLEWEILSAVNNLERDLELETDVTGEGFVYTPEFDTLIGQFVETVRALRGSPPAAKSVVDNLPSVALKKGDLKECDNDCVICAVCKDEIKMDEKVTQLPCRHHYHGECIVPWLGIRNTCPVCRFELPTDDVDYERSKNRMNDDELRVGYGF
ncbi:uncharacterized protein [Rutidosis leptorrhynchoides]|uniref:uncharacterized protein n=1 Tax=Rutidosis leptorrhynchoides TaxID=125765 RepID=UPI003A999D2C